MSISMPMSMAMSTDYTGVILHTNNTSIILITMPIVYLRLALEAFRV